MISACVKERQTDRVTERETYGEIKNQRDKQLAERYAVVGRGHILYMKPKRSWFCFPVGHL